MAVRTDRRVRKTKAALRHGLAVLTKKKSIKEITVKELVEEVDINRSTFYLHYTDIYSMVAELESELLEEFKNAIDLYPPTNSEEEMCRFFEHIYNILNDNREICVALVSENGDISFIRQVETFVSERIKKIFESGMVKNVYDVRYVFDFCISGGMGLFKHWLTDENALEPAHMAKITTNMVVGTLKSFDNNFQVSDYSKIKL
ncbi:TetR-like C-terminal domain-containing protein [Ruminococcus sp.]|jgi:AcrR family transcriptional regulator|uniref:TetR-like C-terminal domain-containing protein n=1 Tax=Ruminococcus sp. TaxID=41978 RepID=UPI003AF51200